VLDAMKKGVSIVNEAFIQDSIAAGAKQDEKKYTLWSDIDDANSGGDDILSVLQNHSKQKSVKVVLPPLDHQAAAFSQALMLAEKYEDSHDPSGLFGVAFRVTGICH
jgi:hypothetical protein